MRKKYFKATKGRSAGLHPYTANDMQRVGWCHGKDIFVAVTPSWKESMNDWKVEIRINGRIHSDPKTYNGYDAQTKMYEYYKYYYDKNVQESK